MKKILLLLILTVSILYAGAQDIMEGKVEYQKKEQPALIIELPYSPQVVEDAIKDYLNKRGSKASSSKGYQMFKGTRLSELDTEGSDVYFKVERKSRKEKDASVVYMFVTKPNENPITRVVETQDLSAARSFVNNMLPSLEAYNLETDISAQENEVKKAEKKFERLVDDQKDMEKRLKKLQENIEENRRDQDKQRQEIEKQKIMLEGMRGRRKS
jgi:hypothetical protein